MLYFHMYYKIFFSSIRERDVQGNIIVQRFQINGNLSNNDIFSSYFYTYLLQPMYSENSIHTLMI